MKPFLRPLVDMTTAFYHLIQGKLCFKDFVRLKKKIKYLTFLFIFVHIIDRAFVFGLTNIMNTNWTKLDPLLRVLYITNKEMNPYMPLLG